MMNPRCLAVVLAALAIVACDGKDSTAPTAPAPATGAVVQPSAAERAASMRRVIVRWLECEECVDGELDALKALGTSAVPSLAATLRDGPSPASREKLRLYLEDAYRRISATTGAPITPDPEFVRVHLDNQSARYRARSAQALAAIGGNDARAALRAMAGYHLRPDVQEQVDEALSQLGP